MYKFLAVIAVLVVLEELAEFAYRHTASYRASRSGYAHIHGEIPGDLEIVNVGSGPGLYGIGYEYCSRKGFNFSTAPQNFINGFRLLKRFSSKIRLHAIIIIIIMCPMSFGRNSDYDSPGYYDKFYGVLPPDEIPGYSRLRALLISHPLMLRVVNKIMRVFRRSSPSAKISANDARPGLIRGWTSEFNLANLTDPSQAEAHKDVFAEKISILTEEIEYCKAHGWHPVMVIPPVSANARAYISPEFVKAFVHDNMKVLADKFPDVKTLDYFADGRIAQEMFRDDIFLNAEGRKTFSRILFADIEKVRAENGHKEQD